MCGYRRRRRTLGHCRCRQRPGCCWPSGAGTVWGCEQGLVRVCKEASTEQRTGRGTGGSLSGWYARTAGRASWNVRGSGWPRVRKVWVGDDAPVPEVEAHGADGEVWVGSHLKQGLHGGAHLQSRQQSPALSLPQASKLSPASSTRHARIRRPVGLSRIAMPRRRAARASGPSQVYAHNPTPRTGRRRGPLLPWHPAS